MIDDKDYLDALRKTISDDNAIKDQTFLELEKEIESLKAQLAQYQSDDYVLVPKKPTNTMIDAVRAEHEAEPYLPYSIYEDFMKRKNVERPEVLGDSWISIDDSLPEEFKSVAVYSAIKGVFPAWVVDGNKWRNHLHEINDITRWQPLPLPPKGAK